MGDFFKGRSFKVLFALLILIFAFLIRAAYDGTGTSVLSQAVSYLTTPVQRAVSGAAQSVSDTASELFRGKRIAAENEALRRENADLRSQLVEHERYKAENERLRAYLDIKEQAPQLEFAPAQVIGRDSAERFYSFTIDSGSLDGIKVGDPVITDEGLVGFVQRTTGASAQISTVLDVACSIGAIDIATREIGVTEGTVALAADGLLRLSYLPRESEAKAGDLVVTSGAGDTVPKNLVIGTIREVLPDSKGLSLYAVLEPPADLRDVRDVLVITQFPGNTPDEPAPAEPSGEEAADGGSESAA